ncbi:glycerophosphodiester phosphodiesterase family protein [Ancylomarina sp. 16SWW S1-10-2]|uniref:glycerophosphodiester phosphodiesterase family protein n=1 Tax=Ancylomarina sp. 16SWW S1-10-2 TaxID=2499681 RepID=UPI0012AD3D82|nr:glycerophosphodiester phosphodiesterase family protein [Ancylomarina sp. 16SWW S1-10-2]MRT93929.1 glycerophosphodiester phosphodiesterase [Ancylomarina sp. 16SWW S1-10-2]
MNSIRDKIVAHRGESFIAPENTLSAIKLAWEKGAKAIEIDIHLTADNKIVVIHDKHTGRVGDRKLFVKKRKLHELKGVDVGLKKSEAYKGERIPTLDEVIETVPLDAKLIIEIKCGKEIVNSLLKLLKRVKLRDNQIEIISFNFDVLSLIKKLAPQYKVLCLLDLDYYLPQWLLRIKPQEIIKKIKDSGLDGVDVWAGKILDQSFVKAFKEEELCVYVWTVNDLVEAERILSYGVDAITTDRAEWITKQLVGNK